MTYTQHVSRIPETLEAAYEAALVARGLATPEVPALLYARREDGVIWHVVACDEQTIELLEALVNGAPVSEDNPEIIPLQLGQGTDPDAVTDWRQPFGAGDAIPMRGDTTSYDSKTWESLIDFNVWAPPIGWREVVSEGYPAWVQPTGAHDAYPLNFIVTYEGKTWQNTGSAANVWAPGVFGWTEL